MKTLTANDVLEIQSRATQLQGYCGSRFDSLEKDKLYFVHEFVNGLKTKTYPVKFKGYSETGNADFLLDKEGKDIMTYSKGINPYLCNVWNSAPNIENATIIGDR